MTKKIMMLLCAVALTVPQGVFARVSVASPAGNADRQRRALEAAAEVLAGADADAGEATTSTWRTKARNAWDSAREKASSLRDRFTGSRFGKKVGEFGSKAWDNKYKIAAALAALGFLIRQNDAVNKSRLVPGTRLRNALFPQLGLQMPRRGKAAWDETVTTSPGDIAGWKHSPADTAGGSESWSRRHDAVDARYNPFRVKANASLYDGALNLPRRVRAEYGARKDLWTDSTPEGRWKRRAKASLYPFSVQEAPKAA